MIKISYKHLPLKYYLALALSLIFFFSALIFRHHICKNAIYGLMNSSACSDTVTSLAIFMLLSILGCISIIYFLYGADRFYKSQKKAESKSL